MLEQERGCATQPLLDALLETRSCAVSVAVREAARQLICEHAPWTSDLADVGTTLIESLGDERDQRLFVAWALVTPRRSQQELAREEGVSSPRIGQILDRAQSRARALAASGPLRWAVATLQSKLGGVTRTDRLVDVLGKLGAGEAPAAQLVSWLAGPYLPVTGQSGWLAKEPAALVGTTRTRLAADGGMRQLEEVKAELADFEIRDDELIPWLNAAGAVVVHGLVVSLAGHQADALERLLDAYGTPRTPEQLAGDLATGGRTVEGAGLARVARARRFAISGGRVRLASWGENGAPAIRRRQGDQQRQPKADVHAIVHCDAAGQARAWLWVRVDEDVLHGCAAEVPSGLVERLGLVPPARRTFSSRWGPVTLAHDGPHPTRGSVRAVALAAGARHGDTLLLGFAAEGDVAVEVRRGTVPVKPAAEQPAAATLFPELSVTGAKQL